MRKSILIIYHSGAGSTKTIAELYHRLLKELCPECVVSLEPISLRGTYEDLHRYDAVIIGFPTYHSEPPASMKQFVETVPVMNTPQKLFLFTTYGLFPANSLRNLGKQLKEKRFVLCGSAGYRAPATDAALLLPKIPPFTVPLFDGTRCEHCFRCIHHCPGNAIVLSKKTQARVKLTPQFYAKKKSVLEEQINRKKIQLKG